MIDTGTCVEHWWNDIERG